MEKPRLSMFNTALSIRSSFRKTLGGLGMKWAPVQAGILPPTASTAWS